MHAQTKVTDTRGRLSNFLKLSQNDLIIRSKSVVAAEKEAYAANAKADTNTDGEISYFEYLSYLNKTTPNTITKFDFAMAQILPSLNKFSFNDKGGTIGQGVFISTTVLPGKITVPAGATIVLLQDGLLVNSPAGITDPDGVVQKNADGAVFLLPFATPFSVLANDWRQIMPECIDVAKAQELLSVPSNVKSPFNGKSITEG